MAHFLAAPSGPHRQPRPCVWGPEGAPLPTPAQTVPAIAAIRHAEGRGASGGAPSEAGFVCSCAPPEEHAALCEDLAVGG